MPIKIIIPLIVSILHFNSSNAQEVRVAGSMMQTMRQGKIDASISLDSIAQPGYYGLGPLTYLNGELMLMNGKLIRSRVVSSDSMLVDEPVTAEAPFFVYANVTQWKYIPLPDSIISIAEIEKFLSDLSFPDPFPFILKGNIQSATIHIVNMPEGRVPSSPQEAHEGRTFYELEAGEVEILGFFSTLHKGIFTHHDSYVHMHLITGAGNKMGHVDKVSPSKMILLVPVSN